ncbi:sensor histidine kinase [Spirosoma soli]|uniref:Sensor histidine kinase n=1 Tax=Spirosoma soli TaxID=1770529 RepID=A0ABW5M781_9BACT
MKKAILFLIIHLLTLATGYAQIIWDDYSQSYTEGAMSNSPTVGLIVALRKGNDFMWSIREKSKHFDTLDKDANFKRVRPKDIIARTTFDTARAQFFLSGVGPQNAHLFQFRVIEYPSNRVLVPWRTINQFTDSALIKSIKMPKMAYLGGYKTSFGNMLILDVRKTESNRIIATSLVAWEVITPSITSIYTSENIDQFFKKLQYPWAKEKQPTDQQSPVLTVPSTNTNLVFVLRGTIFYKEQIQYELIRNGNVYTPWRYNDYDNSFVWIQDCPPGSYVIKIRFSSQPSTNVTEYRFDVEPAWYQTNLFRIVVGIFVAALLGACVFGLLFIRQRRKTQQQESDRTKLQLELKAIHAQLNPHFVFNALSSIQGLINRQDIKGANSYLSDFARLMRESLNYTHKDEIALQEEIKTLDTYLKLEQLRFGFQYAINVDAAINVYETNIPVLLLQPLVENAVKHGVATLQEKGAIIINFNRADHNMIVTITDNGKGFTNDIATTGLGLRLTRDRINLLNKLHPEWQLSLDINNTVPSGTQVTLSYKNWF